MTRTRTTPPEAELLTSVVGMARAAFSAAASSVLVLDALSAEFVFAAVAGEGAGHLVGRRFPADRGIAGWVAASGEPVIVDRLSRNAMFARDIARGTGYVPESIMAAQIARDGACLGVLEVLDGTPRSGAEFDDIHLLTLLAEHAALVLGGLGHHPVPDIPRRRDAVAGAIRQLESWDPPAQEAACQLLRTLAAVLDGSTV